MKNPGPGKYSPQMPESQKYKAISIGVGDRMNFIANSNVPGPGLYNLAMRHTTAGFSYKNHKIESAATIKIDLKTEGRVLAQLTIPKEFPNKKGMFEYETLYNIAFFLTCR